MKRRTSIQLVLTALAALLVVALPAGVSAREPAGTCQNAALYGQSDDDETWFRLPPYPFGRNAEHIYFGPTTVEVEIHDLSTEHNFRIKDIRLERRPRQPRDESTAIRPTSASNAGRFHSRFDPESRRPTTNGCPTRTPTSGAACSQITR